MEGIGWFGVTLFALLVLFTRLIWVQHPPASEWRRTMVGVLFGGGIVALFCIEAGLPQHAANSTTREHAFDLCVSQPLMRNTAIPHMVHELLQRPHPPVYDTMSEDGAVNAIRYQEATKCAEFLSSHPDVYQELARQSLGNDMEDAWTAYNVHCKPTPTADCIRAEVEAARAVSKGPRDARSWCAAHDMDGTYVRWERCMDDIERGSSGVSRERG
jgi:hypothetical protein